jgi:hypothetical protein
MFKNFGDQSLSVESPVTPPCISGNLVKLDFQKKNFIGDVSSVFLERVRCILTCVEQVRRVLDRLITFLTIAIVVTLTFCAMIITVTGFQNRMIREWLYPAPTDRIGDAVRDLSREGIMFKPAPEAATLPTSS